MSATPPKAALSLDDFADLLTRLYAEGVEAIVIGGCAVGAYAHLVGERVLSADLDILVSGGALESVLAAASADGARILKRPQPRAVPVALLEWRGKEVNVLTASAALAPAETEIELAREFHLNSREGAVVLVVDPYELLRDKLACNRSKDRPHIDILLRFLEEEVVHTWSGDEPPRRRIAPARRLLETLREPGLRDGLADRLIASARTGPELRFLARRVPPSRVEAVRARAATLGLAGEIASILEARTKSGAAPRSRRSRTVPVGRGRPRQAG